MKLHIDGHEITAPQGATLLELIRQLGLDDDSLLQRPLAAKIAGSIYVELHPCSQAGRPA